MRVSPGRTPEIESCPEKGNLNRLPSCLVRRRVPATLTECTTCVEENGVRRRQVCIISAWAILRRSYWQVDGAAAWGGIRLSWSLEVGPCLIVPWNWRTVFPQ